MAFSLTWLPEVLKHAGLKVVEQPGWQNRGHGDVGPIRGVMCHHTAGPPTGNMPSLRIVTEGREDLSGPLAQLCLGRDGTFYVVAAGKAYHAGEGNWRSEIKGNARFIGIEAENTGYTTGPHADPWPEVQLDAYRRGVAAILNRIGAGPHMCCGHKEYAPHRKIDPSFDMNHFRSQVAAIMADTAPRPGSTPAVDANNRPTLRVGATGPLVEELQRRLGVDVDGEFGPKTETAVRQFQREHRLDPDGIVGQRTWAAVIGSTRLNEEPAMADHVDVYVLARTLWGEARGEGRAGMEAVACVILNRADKRERRWPNEVAKVCQQPKQFSCWNPDDPNLARLQRVDASDPTFKMALEVAGIAVAGMLPDPTGGANHYHTAAVQPDWSEGEQPVATIGRHKFFKL
jgi:spore germination cell wall hydrolase CwlJ-like protein